MWRGGWPQPLQYSEVRYQPVSIVPGWVTTRILVKNPCHTYTVYNQQYTSPNLKKSYLITFRLLALDVEAKNKNLIIGKLFNFVFLLEMTQCIRTDD